MPEQWQALLSRDHEGSRRAGAVAKVFGHLVRKYVDAGVATALAELLNRERNKPPLDPEEVARICDDIADREFERRGQP